MAIEDSACLAECLGSANSTTDITDALRAFEKIRKPRTEWAKIRGSSFSLPLYHLTDGPEQEARDKRFSGIAGGLASTQVNWTSEMLDTPPAPPQQGGHQLSVPYLYGHNVLEYVCSPFQ
jgi:salicylate hydroxylase